MRTPQFDEEWKDWITTNLERGCDKDEIFKILIDEGFEFQAIKTELNHEPSVPLENIQNPLTEIKPKVSLANAQQLGTDKAEIFIVEDFLNQEECERLIDLIKADLRPSTVTTPTDDKTHRTSKTCDLSKNSSDLVKEIDLRICQYMGINPKYSEGIQGQYYNIGEEFKPHTDFFESYEMEEHGSQQGQRTMTCMIYLNAVALGGETKFVRIGETITSQTGKMLIWNNLDALGEPNHMTLHHGMPVQKGYKAIITKWFR